MPAGVGARVAERVVLDPGVRDRRLAVPARTDVEAGVVHARGVDLIERAVHGVRDEDAVAAEETRVERGEVGARPAVQADHPGPVAAVPPDLVPVVAVSAGAIEVAHGEVLEGHVVGLEHDEAVTHHVLAVDDDLVAIHPTHVQVRRRDAHGLVVGSGVDEDPVAGLRRGDRGLDRRVVLVARAGLRDDEHRAGGGRRLRRAARAAIDQEQTSEGDERRKGGGRARGRLRRGRLHVDGLRFRRGRSARVDRRGRAAGRV